MREGGREREESEEGREREGGERGGRRREREVREGGSE